MTPAPANSATVGSLTSSVYVAPGNTDNGVLNIGPGTTLNIGGSPYGGLFVACDSNSNGGGGVAVLNQTGGVINDSWLFYLGGKNTVNNGANGTFNLSGGTCNLSGGMNMSINNNSTSTLNVSGNGVLNLLSGTNLAMGLYYARPATVNQSGGLVAFYSDGGYTLGGGSLVIEGGGAYTYNLGGGTLAVPSIAWIPGNGAYGGGSYVFNLNGGVLETTAPSTSFFPVTSGTTTINGMVNVQAGGAIINTDGNDVTIASSLKHSGTGTDGGLSMIGPGMLTLTGSNTYNGGTFVTAGTLQLGSNNALGTGGLTANNGTVDLAGWTPSVTTLNGLAGTITSSLSGASLTVSNGGTFAGTIQDGNQFGTDLPVALNVSGGLLKLSGTNTYSGGTLVTGGTLHVGSINALGTGGLAVNNATVDLAGFSPSITTLNGTAGTITSSVSSGSLSVNNGGAFSGTIEDGGLNAPVTLILNGGELSLSGTDTYSGGTLVTSGTLALENPQALAGGSSLTVGNASQLGGLFQEPLSRSPALAVVPEPGTFALLIAGLVVGLGAWQRRKRS